MRERVTEGERGVALEKETRYRVAKVKVTGWLSSMETCSSSLSADDVCLRAIFALPMSPDTSHDSHMLRHQYTRRLLTRARELHSILGAGNDYTLSKLTEVSAYPLELNRWQLHYCIVL